MKRSSPVETTGPATARSVERVCAVLGAFTAEEPQLTLAALAARTGLPKPTVYRLASSLVTTGFLDHLDGGVYALGLRISDLGAVARQRVDVGAMCAPVLDALADACGETVLLSTVDWDTLELIVLASRPSPQPLSVLPRLGRRFPISPGAIGKAVLMGLPREELPCFLRRLPLEALTDLTCTDPEALTAELDGRREAGYVEDHGEFLVGVGGVAVPVLVEHGRPRAAIGVIGPTTRVNPDLDRHGRLLLDATRSLRSAA